MLSQQGQHADSGVGGQAWWMVAVSRQARFATCCLHEAPRTHLKGSFGILIISALRETPRQSRDDHRPSTWGTNSTCFGSKAWKATSSIEILSMTRGLRARYVDFERSLMRLTLLDPFSLIQLPGGPSSGIKTQLYISTQSLQKSAVWISSRT